MTDGSSRAVSYGQSISSGESANTTLHAASTHVHSAVASGLNPLQMG